VLSLTDSKAENAASVAGLKLIEIEQFEPTAMMLQLFDCAKTNSLFPVR
jgi:hypothetical protein